LNDFAFMPRFCFEFHYLNLFFFPLHCFWNGDSLISTCANIWRVPQWIVMAVGNKYMLFIFLCVLLYVETSNVGLRNLGYAMPQSIYIYMSPASQC
jgi:hypothetical protein